MPIPQDRDTQAISTNLANWLNEQPGVESARVSGIDVPSASGFSNETLLGDLLCKMDGKDVEMGIVVRMRPTDYAIFPEYNMAVQYRSMQAVAAASDVPVAEVLWTEDSGEVLGQPFFVMKRLYGRVPSDNPPFYSEGFVIEASEQEQNTLWTSSIKILADIAGIDWKAGGFAEFLDQPQYGELGFKQQLGYYKHYLEWGAEGRPQPTLETALDYFIENDPSADMLIQLNWGDARPSNMMYGEDFKPIAVFDWEMATLGPGEVDLGWYISMNRWQCESAQAKWPPGFPSREETKALYEKFAGRQVQHLDYFEAWGYFRFCVIMIRIIAMQIAYGDLTEDMRIFERLNPAVEMLAEKMLVLDSALEKKIDPDILKSLEAGENKAP